MVYDLMVTKSLMVTKYFCIFFSTGGGGGVLDPAESCVV